MTETLPLLTWPTPPAVCPVCDSPQIGHDKYSWGEFITYKCLFDIRRSSDEQVWHLYTNCWNMAAALAWRTELSRETARANMAEFRANQLSEAGRDFREQRDDALAQVEAIRTALDWALNVVEAAIDYHAQGNAQVGISQNLRWFRECFEKGRAALAPPPPSQPDADTDTNEYGPVSLDDFTHWPGLPETDVLDDDEHWPGPGWSLIPPVAPKGEPK